jgi:CCR4-NOT transcription complex subunit 1
MMQLPVQSLAALPSNHDIRHLLRQILYLANEAVDRQRTPLMMSQKIVQLLYKTPSQLGREVFVALLDQLCHTFEDVAKEAITWLLYAEDEVSQFLSSYNLQPSNINVHSENITLR